MEKEIKNVEEETTAENLAVTNPDAGSPTSQANEGEHGEPANILASRTSEPISLSRLLRKGPKLRRSLLKKIKPVGYRDVFKGQGLSTSSILGPIIDQKVDRFAAMFERLLKGKI